MNPRPKRTPEVIEGRRLFQRMLTLHVAGKHHDAAAEIFMVTDVRIIMAALNVSVAGMSQLIHGSLPDPAKREEYLTELMVSLEQQE